ncbi:MAG: KTSC domain-containing protein [Terriglobales bacterium]|jgi:hypothetical protein
MERISVISSNVHSVGYDLLNAILEVMFLNGGLYWYFGVPLEIAEALVNASSVGGYLAQNIKPYYPYERRN